ncbi:MAG: DUF2304 domain-containing protein [Firmicutes bacterium]|nr:DUF2304 domain-containing protein [Bacillota bacterium]
MNVYVLGVLFSLAFLVAVVDLMRRRLLLEQYSLFWLGMAIVILLLSVFHDALNRVASSIGIYYAPSLLFLIGFLFMLGTMLHLTVALSKMMSRSVRMVQEMGILRAELDQALQRLADHSSQAPLSEAHAERPASGLQAAAPRDHSF